jgi:hypothetical protein
MLSCFAATVTIQSTVDCADVVPGA